MKLIAAIIGVLAAIYVLIEIILPRRRGTGISDYHRRESIMSPGETAFHAALVRTVGPGIRVFAQVPLRQLVVVRADPVHRQAAQNRIHQKTVDFVLSDAATLETRIVIELDDRSHNQARRQDRDQFVNAVLEHVGMPLVRIRAAAHYDPVQIREQLARAGVVIDLQPSDARP